MMKIIICSLLMVMHFSGYSAGGGGKGSKHDLLKIHVPEIVKHQHHTHYVFIHKHAPKKAKETKKKEVKHHHHKHIHLPDLGHHKHHFFGIHTHGHKHTKHTSHVAPAVHHKVHKVVVHPPHHHVTHPHVTHPHVTHPHVSHKGHHHVAAKPHPHHGYKVHPVGHGHKHTKVHKVTHSHVAYPYSHDESYDPAPGTNPPYSISSGYEVTENYDPESEVYDGPTSVGGYGGSEDYSESHGDDEQNDGVDYENESGVSKSYSPDFFSNPYAGGMNSEYANNPGVSSYDISPYHQLQSHNIHSQTQHAGLVQTVQQPNNAEEIQPNFNYVPQVMNGHHPQYFSPAYAGDYSNMQQNYDSELVPENDFMAQHNGYSDASHIGQDSDEFAENVPGYTNHHKRFHNEINQGVRTNLYDHRTINDGNNGAPVQDNQNEVSGFHHVYRYGTRLK